jgi:hypothetical protein
MTRHRETLLLLYDYCEGTLAEPERLSVEEHLRECTECAGELALMEEARGVLGDSGVSPADHLPDSYWVGFANSVQAALPAVDRPTSSALRALLERARGRRIRPALAFGGALAVFLLALVLSRGPAPDGADRATGPAEARPAMADLPVDTVGLQMERYLKRSKTLLVGLQNAEIDEEFILPPVAERRLSRQLAEESRRLKTRGLDPHGTRLVNDLEKIFIGLANTPDDGWTPAVQVIRSGVEEENLLFKIRMAESAYGHARVIPASATR